MVSSYPTARTRRRLGGLAVVAALLLGMAIAPPPRADAYTLNLTRTWDLGARQGQDGQLAVYNKDNVGGFLGMPVAGGDVNGEDSDGTTRDDVVLAPFYATAGPQGSRPAAGKLRLFFGTSTIRGAYNPEDASDPKGVEIWGARAGDFLGNEVTIGDVTGDGIGDIVAGAQNADGFGAGDERPQAGAAYVITGRATWPDVIDIGNLGAGAGVLQILGARGSNPSATPPPGDRFGFWVSTGDVTGDGVADILVSADLAEAAGSALNVGVVYVIPGGDNLKDAGGALRQRIDLASPDPVKVYKIVGIDQDDHFGSSIASADMDGDGIDDILTSAGVTRSGAGLAGFGQASGASTGGADGPPGQRRDDAGEVYVIYGKSAAAWDDEPVLRLAPSPTNAFSIYYGVDPFGYFGEDVSAGDVDGDGRAELLVGGLLVNAPFPTGQQPYRADSGAGYVFWGRMLQRGEAADLKTLLGTSRVTAVYGEFPGDIGADSFRAADVDADGVDDLLFGAPNNSGAGTEGPMRQGAGDLKVIFGTRTGLPAVIDTKAPPAGVAIHQVTAPDPGDMLTYSLDSADFDGDGYEDILTNAMAGDGFNNAHTTSGELYVVSGRLFSLAAGRGPADTPLLTGFTASPAQGPYYAGAAGVVITLRGDHFEPGATVTAVGVGPLPAGSYTIDSPQQITVRLDQAPDVLRAAGALVFQVSNPAGGASNALQTVTLLGPAITGATASKRGGAFKIKVTGENFRPGATVEVARAGGEAVAVAKVKVKPTKINVTLGSGAPRGEPLSVRVVNPGGVVSNSASVTLP